MWQKFWGRVSNADNQIKLVFNIDEAQHTKIEKNAVVRIVKAVESAANFRHRQRL